MTTFSNKRAIPFQFIRSVEGKLTPPGEDWETYETNMVHLEDVAYEIAFDRAYLWSHRVAVCFKNDPDYREYVRGEEEVLAYEFDLPWTFESIHVHAHWLGDRVAKYDHYMWILRNAESVRLREINRRRDDDDRPPASRELREGYEFKGGVIVEKRT